jgi:hypothetical protein
VLVGSRRREPNRSKGFSARFARLKKGSKVYMEGQGPNCKTAGVFFLLCMPGLGDLIPSGPATLELG